MPKLNRLAATRIVATPASLDALVVSAETIVMRTAPDELLLIPAADDISVSDDHAIILSERGFHGVWLDAASAETLFAHHCEWQLPVDRPTFAQGAIADIPAKLWLEADRVFLVVAAPYASKMTERIA